MSARRYVISYDVTDNGRRNRIARLLQGFGARIQKSVFELVADPDILAECLHDLQALLKPDEDSVAIYPLCRRCSTDREYLGVAANRTAIGEEEVFIV